ncbi:polyisoprenoid-binding protein YceI [Algoriphagus ratkowskyi]|uniref:Polyisoprenoid-binding protein YceI n=1 Tax=Algoriphagus ratkowskyi TaxID=57028 RepID=A0A2W7RIR1_9BACT|nr:YceI family protein [Algoriphagus ratkowskyi]PZX58310.1 polyisoprenoid-binding protein YceI [Algoriphagus ratkowskyi]TXD77815.1 YceI family protein [Algoriphagus ratkowskyi]
MNKLFLIGFLFLFICGEKKNPTERITKFPFHPVGNFSNDSLDTLHIDLNRSSIKWKGTKMMGLGSHEGEISIQKGYLLVQDEILTGGEISVDMRSITVTDIPATDPIPIRNLTNHLKSTDFFDVDKYPISNLNFLSIEKLQNNNLLVHASLTIKGISNPVSFEIEKLGINHFQTSLQIDRFEWDIAYSGSWVDRTLVDREIDLRVELVGK